MVTLMSNKRLQRALRFKETDLAANQAGKLSKRQVRRIRRQRTNYSVAAYLFGGLFLLAAIILWRQTMIGSVFFGIVGALVIYGEFRLARIPVENLEVEHITGTVKKVQAIDEADELDYIIRVNDTDFEASYREFIAFVDGQRYTVHFVRFAAEDGLPVDTPPLIVSAESLSKVTATPNSGSNTTPQTA